MSIAQHPASVPYETYVRMEQERDQWRTRYTQEQQAHAQTKRLLGQAQQAQQQRRKLLKAPWKSTEKLVIEEMQRQVDSPHATRDEAGFTRFCYKTAGMSIGTDEKTPKRAIEAILKQCPDLPIETKTVEEARPDGARGTIKRLYIKPVTEQGLISAAAVAHLSAPIKQGGNQYQCQNPLCLSHNVRIERQLVCMDCGHKSNLEPTFPNGKLKGAERAESTKTNLSLVPANPASDEEADDLQAERAESTKTNLSLVSNDAPPAENFLPEGSQLVDVVIKPLTPPNIDNLDDTPADEEADILAAEDTEDLTRAAELLLQIAGDDQQQIEMSKTGAKKYYTVDRRLTFFDLVAHLRGGQAKGARCSYQDGSTYALIFDTDDCEEWDAWRETARRLNEAGYTVLFDESPAGRGGHLLIIFDARVNAAAARAAVLEIAPELADCREYWPGPASVEDWNRVRLPGAKYVRRGQHVETPINAWCKLLNTLTGETADDGTRAARLLLSSLTPAEIVPALPVISAQDETTAPEIPVQVEQPQARQVEPEPVAPEIPTQDEQEPEARQVASAGAGELRLPKVDSQWEKNYGKVERTTLWFAVIEEYAAAWFNERHELEEIRPRERNKMALSPNGNERTASTSYRNTAQGERYTDHSTHGRRSDGSRDSGDALELACKVWERDKSDLLRETSREIVKEARADLESAAAAGQPLPAWLEEIITPAGRRKYAQLFQVQGRKVEPTVTPAAVTIEQPAPEIPAQMEQPQARQVEPEEVTPEIHSEPKPAPAAQVVTELPEIKRPALVERKAPRPVGMCLVADHKTGKACGCTRWWPSAEEEHVCSRCLSPIAWTRNIEARQAR